jgi:hypothetical protein
MLGTIHRTVLTSCTSEADHQVGKTPLLVSCDRRIDKVVAVIQKANHLAVVFKKCDHLLIETCKRFVSIVFAGIIDCTTVKNKAAAIA